MTFEVAANEGSLVATFVLPLMRRPKIKTKNTKLLMRVISGDFIKSPLMRREKIKTRKYKGH
jgi:hypothetical protein